jgi:hypothetical protein
VLEVETALAVPVAYVCATAPVLLWVPISPPAIADPAVEVALAAPFA